jgi:trans-2,3-dihydro-3-hydroxyanthranilate isomerase
VTRRYAILDVFTEAPLAGNPLAVVLEAEGLDDAAMQQIAREFNLSETVFVLPPENPAHTARLRIFTPRRELPFAGHPTIGTAVLLASERASQTGDSVIVLEEGVGPVRCGVMTEPGIAGRAVFDLPRLPEELPIHIDHALAASTLELLATDIGFENHTATCFTAGNPFVFLPVRNRAMLAECQPNRVAFENALGGQHSLFVYARDPVHQHHHFAARMFSYGLGVAEDPATGSAVAAFAGVIMKFDGATDGEHSYVVEQGYDMGRPSEILLELVAAGGALQSARVAGAAVIVARGELLL